MPKLGLQVREDGERRGKREVEECCCEGGGGCVGTGCDEEGGLGVEIGAAEGLVGHGVAGGEDVVHHVGSSGGGGG